MLKIIGVVACLIAGTAAGTANTSRKSQSPSAPAAVVDEFLDAYRELNVDRMAALLAPDVVFEDPTFRLRATGRHEWRRMAESLRHSYSVAAIDVHSTVASGDVVAIEQTVSGVVKRKDGSSHPIKVRGASFFRVRAGLITKWTDYFDFQTFSEQARPVAK